MPKNDSARLLHMNFNMKTPYRRRRVIVIVRTVFPLKHTVRLGQTAGRYKGAAVSGFFMSKPYLSMSISAAGNGVIAATI